MVRDGISQTLTNQNRAFCKKMGVPAYEMGVGYFGGGADKKRFALQPPLTWPSEVVGGCKRLGGSYVELPTKNFFRHNQNMYI